MRSLALLIFALLLAAPALASEERPTQAEIEAEVICPTCQSTLDQSNAPIARRMKAFIARRIAAGDSKSEIESRLVDEFGQGVLASPPRSGFNLLAWVLPLAGLAAGAAVLGLLAWRWSRVREEEPPSGGDPSLNGHRPLEPELERRLDEELARFDG
jgi:cytochrome c-type biogenesis protein CcmH